MQGSKDVYKLAPAQFFILDNALNSACGLPLYEVIPEEITLSSFTTIAPTEGFKPVFPKFISASWYARSK